VSIDQLDTFLFSGLADEWDDKFLSWAGISEWGDYASLDEAVAAREQREQSGGLELSPPPLSRAG
jgi:hypothetical protein